MKQEDIITVSLYVPNVGVPNFKKQTSVSYKVPISLFISSAVTASLSQNAPIRLLLWFFFIEEKVGMLATSNQLSQLPTAWILSFNPF
jgi:hypothetical protein